MEVVFNSAEEALQHLSDITGKKIKVANTFDNSLANKLNTLLQDRQNNYHQKVCNCLHNIITNTRGISEKAFASMDIVTKEVETFASTNEVMQIIERFEKGNYRPEYCAETLFSQIKQN